MNREIKFRGKSIMDNSYGEWLHSSGIKYEEDVELMYCDEDTSEEWHYIDKNTLGQYTGLHDKNGKEIYEGDIVKFRFKTDRQEFSDIIGYIEYQTTFTAFLIMSFVGSFKIDIMDLKFIEVIGNVYDNPELLGGE